MRHNAATMTDEQRARSRARRRDWARRVRGTPLANRRAEKHAEILKARAQDPAWAEKERERQRLVKQEMYAGLDEAGREYYRSKVRLRHTGWTQEAALAAAAAQGGKCYLCPRELAPGRGTHRDHYETVDGVRVKSKKTKGAVKHPRALLCRCCNHGLGSYESPTGQRAAGLRIDVYEAYIAKFGG